MKLETDYQIHFAIVHKDCDEYYEKENAIYTVWLLGLKIELKQKQLKGIVKYIGEVHFTHGILIGIEIHGNTPVKNSGHIDKVMYFKCKKNGGSFVYKQLQKY